MRTPQDAIILFEACRIGMLPRVQRRLSEKERQSIRSGSVFVWDEREAGMRRWTDGKSWSASRVSGSFLTYREMEGKRGGTGFAQATKTPESGRTSADDGDGGEEGPDGYRYKPDGLMKQSFSITTSTNQHLHLISYYSRAHPNAPGLQQPSTDPNLRTVRPAKGLYPESTVNDQQNVPAVTRSPMAGASPYTMPPHPPPAYPRGGAAHPHSYAYAPSPHPYPIAAMPIPPNGYSHHPYANGYGAPHYGQPYPVPHYTPHPPIPHPHPPPNSLDQRPSRAEDNTNSSLPPPQPRQQTHSSPKDQAQQPAPRIQPAPQPIDTHSPQLRTAPIDPRLTPTTTSTSTSTLPQPNGNPPSISSTITSPSEHQAPPAPQPDPSTLSDPTTTTTTSSQTSKMIALARSASAEEVVLLSDTTAAPEASDRAASVSPGGTIKNQVEGPADIPSQKLAFGEDKRALKALDKVFI